MRAGPKKAKSQKSQSQIINLYILENKKNYMYLRIVNIHVCLFFLNNKSNSNLQESVMLFQHGSWEWQPEPKKAKSHKSQSQIKNLYILDQIVIYRNW